MNELQRLMKRARYIDPSIEKIVKKYRGEDVLRQSDFLRRVALHFTRPEIEKFYKFIRKDDLEKLLNDPPTNNHFFETLKDYLPTPEVLRLIEAEGPSACRVLEAVEERIALGEFDYENPLHKEVEFARYMGQGRTLYYTLDQFSNLPWIEEQVVIVGKLEEQYAEHIAREAIAVFNFIKKTSPNAVVIGNRRYGADWVIVPLEEHLRILGAKIAYERVSSMDHDFDASHPISVSDKTRNVSEEKDIIVVDGTSEPTKDKLSRFPAAMRGYIQAFPTRKITFWTANLTDPTYVGGILYNRCELGDGNLFLVNSTTQNHGIESGPFDDPEIYCRNTRDGFTRYGLASIQIAKSEREFVRTIQDIMKPIINKELR